MSTSGGKKIGVVTATIIGLNAMIGSGIFSAPASMAAYVGPACIVAYGLVSICVWFIAISLSRLTQLYPEEGSFYVYARQWGGHTVGMLAIGAYFIGLLIAMGLLSQMAGQYLHTFFPSVTPFVLGLVALSALTALNMFGVALSQLGQHILIVCTVFPLIAITALCFSKANFANLTPFAPYGFTNVLKAMRVVIFGFFGFECASSLFNIVEKPEKNVPRALTYAIIIIGILYTLFVSSIILSTPLSLFTDPFIPLSETLSVIFPTQSWLIWVIHFAILSAIIGTIHSMIWASSNLLTLIAQKFRNNTIKTLVKRGYFNACMSALWVGLCISISYVTLKSPNLFFNLTSLFIVSAFILSMITLLTLPNEWKSGNNRKTVFGLITASIILIFAIEGIVQEFYKLL